MKREDVKKMPHLHNLWVISKNRAGCVWHRVVLITGSSMDTKELHVKCGRSSYSIKEVTIEQREEPPDEVCRHCEIGHLRQESADETAEENYALLQRVLGKEGRQGKEGGEDD